MHHVVTVNDSWDLGYKVVHACNELFQQRKLLKGITMVLIGASDSGTCPHLARIGKSNNYENDASLARTGVLLYLRIKSSVA